MRGTRVDGRRDPAGGRDFQRVEALVEHPDMGRVVTEFDQSFLRELIHPPFRIMCRRDSLQVRIVRVWRSERLLHLPRKETRNHECANRI